MEERGDAVGVESVLAAPGVLPRVSSTFSSGEHSVQGKAGALWRKEGMPWMSSRYLPLPACSSELVLPSPVLSTPCRGRRVRYGELRSPSCTPFHPPGAPLPWGVAASRFPTPPDFWEKSSVSVPSGIAITRLTRAMRTDSQEVPTRAALTRSVFSDRRAFGGRALESYVPKLRVRRKPSRLGASCSDAHLWEQFCSRW